MLNKITVMGRICNEIELRRTGTGVAVASFTIACDRDFGDKETDFIECVAWKNTAEFVQKYFGKGRMIIVSGRLQIRSWTDKDGNKRKTAEVVAENVYFGDSKNTATDNNVGHTGYATPNSAPASDFAMLDDDDAHLPF